MVLLTFRALISHKVELLATFDGQMGSQLALVVGQVVVVVTLFARVGHGCGGDRGFEGVAGVEGAKVS